MRLHDWQSRFAALILEKQNSKFQWGVNDCALFACDSVLAITGMDPAEAFRGKYDSVASGARLVKSVCGGGLRELIDQMADRYSFLAIKPIYAQRGDLGLYQDPELGDTLGVNIGRTFAFLMEQGLIYLPSVRVAQAWRVG